MGGQRHVEVQERLEDDPIDSYDLTAKVLKDIWIPLMNFLKNILVIVLLVWTILACNQLQYMAPKPDNAYDFFVKHEYQEYQQIRKLLSENFDGVSPTSFTIDIFFGIDKLDDNGLRFDP